MSQLVREPMLSPEQAVVGCALRWSATDNIARPSVTSFVGELVSADAQPDHLLVLPATAETLAGEAIEHLSPQNILLTLDSALLSDPAAIEQVQRRRAQGFNFCLILQTAQAPSRAMTELASFVKIRYEETRTDESTRALAKWKAAETKVLVNGVTDWDQFDQCALQGFHVLGGVLRERPRRKFAPSGVSPQQEVILNLLHLVQSNASPTVIQTAINRDPALVFKLLQFINSASFGPKQAISNVRNALAALGYRPLYQWLSVLLATSNPSHYSPIVLQTGLIRGRMAELLARPAEVDSQDLFVVGMFSVLDKLLGIPLDKIIKRLPLTDPMAKALLENSGPLAPYLRVVAASEGSPSNVTPDVQAISRDTRDVSTAMLQAIDWAYRVETLTRASSTKTG
jgi:c-di-GMP-related signal transduction protein